MSKKVTLTLDAEVANRLISNIEYLLGGADDDIFEVLDKVLDDLENLVIQGP